MKKLILLPLIIFLLVFAKSSPDYSSATVQEIEGIKIFILCKPQSENTYIGTVKAPAIVWKGTAEELMKHLIKRARKDYPGVQGIVINDLSFGKADAIIFK